MKKNLIILCITALMLLSCSDWLDVNHDPNALEEIPSASSLLPASEVGIGNNLMGWDMGFGGAFWVEYWTQSNSASQFKSICGYMPEDFNTAYRSLYSQPLTDLKRIKDMTVEDENRGYYFIAEALSIYAWQIVTDVWGDMPYFEALKGNEGILHPKQDKQQDIYADLKTRIDELLKIDIRNSSIIGSSDYIFGGDLNQWYAFANSLKLKLMIRLSETENYNNADVLNFIESGGFLTGSASISGDIWNDNMEGKRHPMREFETGGANYFTSNVFACKTFIDYLSVNADPRLSTLFSGVVKGAFFGDFGSTEDSDNNGTTDDKETYAKAILLPNMDIPLISAWELNFWISEVYARAGNDAKAKEYYENGVKASLAQHGISDESIIGTGGYAEWKSGDIEVAIKQIAMQKWVANCNYQHIEAFLERNRTKYPSVNEIDIARDRQSAWINFPVGELTISVAGRGTLGGNLPASPTYPEWYVSRNNNAPAQKANIGQKVWWNQKAGK
ncbi:MAG: SusD/RagB family nutrient-binding outer membrane lipoprotein [Cytophagaceae bacterium]|jgi:hypothetical protein|nr:SusD/RagB family nutrient-binding outer membrane lipoprotein [Cytophagaceae bacterium]